MAGPAGFHRKPRYAGGVMFKRIDHVEIVTADPDRAERFYTEILGFKVKARDHIEKSGLGVPMNLAYLELGGTTVELIAYQDAEVAPPPGKEHVGYRMIALEVEDMTGPHPICARRVSSWSGGRGLPRPTHGPRSAIPKATISSCGNGSSERQRLGRGKRRI